MLKNPSKLSILIKEIRTSFADNTDIAMTNVTGLRYLGTVIEEGLRLFPPVGAMSPHMTPNAGAMICGRLQHQFGVALWPAAQLS